MITELRLQHFRSYDDVLFTVDNGVNIIIGPNASGKTNLLEAVLLIARGSSYRAGDAELVQFDAAWARVDAKTLQGARVVKIQRLDDYKYAKSFEIDGHALARLLQNRTLPVTLFEPNHLLLLSGSPELRRSFLDDLIEQTVPTYASTRRHYRRVLAQRNALLKKQPPGFGEQLFVWNLRLSELGGRIATERHALVARFDARMSALYGELSGHRGHRIELTYRSQFPVQQYETALLRKLESSLEHDIFRGFTAYGPHRDDLGVSIDGHPAEESASRGETRTLVLALKMLELYLLEEIRAVKPILLLDDVFSELDSKRRQALTRFVAEYQTFITTTDADVAEYFSHSSTIRVHKSDSRGRTPKSV
ncbi:MAG TPA: DNA replication and repair protein RecF [Candidatus Saccharimonadales bacterium]|nr:DNA replication and repair protein RecF [Candidatus Saccharimonadales bacterium]